MTERVAHAALDTAPSRRAIASSRVGELTIHCTVGVVRVAQQLTAFDPGVTVER